MALRTPTAVAHAHRRVRRAAVGLGKKIGFDSRNGLPRRIAHTAKQMGRSLGLTPHTGIHPGRYWPILLIAVALAESAHAPHLTGALGMPNHGSPFSPAASVKKPPAPPDKNHRDMHGPSGLDDLLAANKKKKKPEDPLLPDVHLLVDPILYHGVHDDVVVPSGGIGYLIDGGGGSGGDILPISPIWNPIVHGGDSGGGGDAGGGGIGGGGGGGGAGGGDGGGGGGNGGATGQGGTQNPVVYDGPGAVSIPEPGSFSILIGGIAFLCRRGDRRQL